MSPRPRDATAPLMWSLRGKSLGELVKHVRHVYLYHQSSALNRHLG